MIRKRLISAYTPSNTDAETRERIFVQRHQLLRRVVGWCEESMLYGNKHHLLFIGPRGCGKTHLVSMVHDRLSSNPDLADKMRVAWLGEDSVFTGLIDFALEIADELSSEYPQEFNFDYRHSAKTLSANDAAEQILDEIVSRLGDKSILLIMENLDAAMRGLGDLGQKKWRAFFQEQRRVATVATSQQLFEDVSSRNAAFYGFFEIEHLEPLPVDDAGELMGKIARENDKLDLVQFLATPEGRYRVRALHHLAGGNHRMYVMLSEFLTKDSLDDLVACFEELADELTPYFQERVGSLSRQQARIVQSLCGAGGAKTVKQIAEDTFIPERNVSKQLGELKQRRFVVSQRRGKESLYDMAEPLMRLCLEVKKQRGKPLKLVAAFLRAWYSESSLRSDLESELGASTGSARSLEYRQTALQLEYTLQEDINRRLVSEFRWNMQRMRFDEATRIAEELVYADRFTGLMRRSEVYTEQGHLTQALTDLNEVVMLPGLEPRQRTEALSTRAVLYQRLGERAKAIADCSAVIEIDEAPADAKATCLINRGITYSDCGDSNRAIMDYSAVLEMADAPTGSKAWALVNRGVLYRELGEPEKAIADYSAAIAVTDGPVESKAVALANRGNLHRELGAPEKAIDDYTAAIEMNGAPPLVKAKALATRGSTYGELDESERAIDDWAAVVEMEEADVWQKAEAMLLRGGGYWRLQEFELAVEDFKTVADMSEVSSYARTYALFALPEATIPTRSVNESVESIEQAFEDGDPETDPFGGDPSGILQMILRREHPSWPEFIERLVPVYAEYRALESLGSGLTESIAFLDGGGYSQTQLDLWNDSWQKAGGEYDDLTIPLAALDAAIQVIKSGNDRALFDLPVEIRQIVRPLLKNALA